MVGMGWFGWVIFILIVYMFVIGVRYFGKVVLCGEMVLRLYRRGFNVKFGF